jgi:hypothetical protein
MSKMTNAKMTNAQVVEDLPSQHEALTSNPSTTKKRKYLEFHISVLLTGER